MERLTLAAGCLLAQCSTRSPTPEITLQSVTPYTNPSFPYGTYTVDNNRMPTLSWPGNAYDTPIPAKCEQEAEDAKTARHAYIKWRTQGLSHDDANEAARSELRGSKAGELVETMTMSPERMTSNEAWLYELRNCVMSIEVERAKRKEN